jgi:hypothetical protein
MNLTEAKEGEEYIIKEILTDDEELICFLLAVTVVNQLQWFLI